MKENTRMTNPEAAAQSLFVFHGCCDRFFTRSVSPALRFSGERLGGQGSQDQGRIREEAERHEQGAPEAPLGSEGARPPAEEPITVREAAEEAADGRGGDEEDEGAAGYGYFHQKMSRWSRSSSPAGSVGRAAHHFLPFHLFLTVHVLSAYWLMSSD